MTVADLLRVYVAAGDVVLGLVVAGLVIIDRRRRRK